MTFNEKMKRIGGVAVMLGLLGSFGVAGGIETLPPEAGLREWSALFGTFMVSASLVLFGVSVIKED